MKQKLIVIGVLVLFLFPSVKADYNGAESLRFRVYALSDSGAVISASYTPYSPGMCPEGCGCALVPSGFCCLLANFFVNDTTVEFLGFSDVLQIHRYSEDYYIFTFTHNTFNDTLKVYRVSVEGIESIANLTANWLYGEFAVSIPYVALRVDREHVLVYNVLTGEKKTMKIKELENGIIPGINVGRNGDVIYLKGKNSLGAEKNIRGEVKGDKISFGSFSIPLWAVKNYTVSPIEVRHLHAFEVGDAYIILPSPFMHYFAPCGNSTREVVEFSNESSSDFSPDVYAFFYKNNKMRPIRLLKLEYGNIRSDTEALNWIIFQKEDENSAESFTSTSTTSPLETSSPINTKAESVCGSAALLVVLLLPLVLVRKNF